MVKMADRVNNLRPPPLYWSAEKKNQYREEAVRIREALKEASPFLAAPLREKIETYGG